MANSFHLDFSFSQDDVNKFAAVSGDTNPIHLDAEYAAKTIFGKPIIHGFLGASIFSRIFGMHFPGEGTIYLKQDMKFLAPMFVDTTYRAEVTELEVIKEKSRARLSTIIKDQKGNTVFTGEALIQNNIYR